MGERITHHLQRNYHHITPVTTSVPSSSLAKSSGRLGHCSRCGCSQPCLPHPVKCSRHRLCTEQRMWPEYICSPMWADQREYGAHGRSGRWESWTPPLTALAWKRPSKQRPTVCPPAQSCSLKCGPSTNQASQKRRISGREGLQQGPREAWRWGGTSILVPRLIRAPGGSNLLFSFLKLLQSPTHTLYRVLAPVRNPATPAHLDHRLFSPSVSLC